ncbi:hypothetical protein ACTHQY_15035 [Rhodococcoides corynebacterioides]
MPFVRWGDTAANHPIVLSVLEHEEFDDRLVNEVNGFVNRCAQQAGAHLTDYVITRGTAVLIAGPSRVDVLVPVAIFAGYMTSVDIDGRVGYKLVDTDHDFLHLRLREEVEFERQRRSDNSNPALIVPVRMRDGDACRYCGRVVTWGSKTGAWSGTYDHLEPGKPATVDTYVVCCRSCNSARSDGTKPRGARTLLTAPSVPYFSKHTVEWITNHQWAQSNGYEPPARSRRNVRPGDPAPGATTSATTSTGLSPATTAASSAAGERTDTQSVNAPKTATGGAPAPRTDTQSVNAPVDTANRHPVGERQKRGATSTDGAPVKNQQHPTRAEGTDLVGTGRDGSGRVGSGRVGRSPTQGDSTNPSVPVANSPRSRRKRRSRRHTRTTTP